MSIETTMLMMTNSIICKCDICKKKKECETFATIIEEKKRWIKEIDLQVWIKENPQYFKKEKG